MGQIVYTADVGEENIAILVDGPLADLSAHVGAVGGDVVLDETAVQRLRNWYDQPTTPGQLDGFVDHRNVMWINGEGYPLTAVDADLIDDGYGP
jgi:hypothetical protein